jgi:hypothetical protein
LHWRRLKRKSLLFQYILFRENIPANREGMDGDSAPWRRLDTGGGGCDKSGSSEQLPGVRDQEPGPVISNQLQVEMRKSHFVIMSEAKDL